MIIDYGFHPAQKPSHKRNKLKRGTLTKITTKVRSEVDLRSGGCERCGCTVPQNWFEMAHLDNASQMGSGRVPWNVARLCSPRTATGTCHQICDDTAAGKAWKQQKRRELIEYYTNGEGRYRWPYDG